MDEQELPNGSQREAGDDQADDVEGHSLALVMGIGQAERNRQQSRSTKAPEDALPPLTKPFPRIRDEKRP